MRREQSQKACLSDVAPVSIYCGDCREVLAALDSESVDMVLTDPPYVVGYRGRWNSDQEIIRGDNDSDWILPAFEQIFRVLKSNSFCVSFYGWPHADIFLSAWKRVGFRPVSHLVCVKNQIGLGYFSRSQHETAYLLAKGNPKKPLHSASDVIEWNREEHPFHPNQKPLATISKILKHYSETGDLILDPFMGSGTTLLAARALGRNALGIEIDERYCTIARQRLAQQILDFGPTIEELEQRTLVEGMQS